MMKKKQLIMSMAALLTLGTGAGIVPQASAESIAAPELQYSVNGQTVKPNKPAMNVEGQLYVPLSDFANLTSQYVDWDATRGSVSFTDKPRLTGKYVLKAPDLAKGVKMGFGSSLTHVPGDPDNVFYTTGDRGPNGEVEVNGETRRTFPMPNYTPSIYKIKLENGEIKVLSTIPLKINGKDAVTGTNQITGLPNVKKHDEVPYDAEAKNVLAYDPYGLDLEGLAYSPADDTFWISEEYGPSIVQVKRDGTILQRLVPKGMAAMMDSKLVPLKEVFPASYLNRRQNRGMEAVSITPDGKWMFAAMQSPLRNPDKSADNSRSLRILKIELSTPKPVAEYAYATDDAKLFKDLKQADIVISDLFAVNENTLLIDERDKNAGSKAQVKKLYLTDLSAATNILSNYDDVQKAGKTLEQMDAAELAKNGIVPPAKRTILDAVGFQYPYEKIEGITVVDGNKLVIINDNDFGVGSTAPENGTELWTFELPYTLK